MLRNLFFCVLLTAVNFCHAQGPFIIGSIQPGDSIVIRYVVSINNPVIPANATSISNQGTVAGSNFSSFSTDDPDSGPPADATLTLLNVFPLPVTLTSWRAYHSGSSHLLEWKTEDEINIDQYMVERSADGRQFTVIGQVSALNSSAPSVYQWPDQQPLPGANFYRLRITESNGTSRYSPVLQLRSGANAAGAILVYPNPVTSPVITLQLQNKPAGLYVARLYSPSGALLMTTMLQHRGGSSGELLRLPGKLPAGLYQLVVNSGREQTLLKLIMY